MSADVVAAHLRDGEWLLARAGAKAALATATGAERGRLLALLARIHVRLGEPREAGLAAEEAARCGDGWEIRLAVGEASHAAGEPTVARATLVAALETLREPDTHATTPDAFRDTAVAEVALGVALAEACRGAGDPAAGLAAAARALAHAEVAFGPASIEAAEAHHVYGACQHAAGHGLKAREALERALELRRRLAPDGVGVAAAEDALGLVARAAGQAERAVAHHRAALAIWVARLGDRAGPVGACRHALAQALHRTGDFTGARDEMTLALRITERTCGGDHVDTWIARFEHGRFDVDCGRVAEGLQVMVEARDRVAARLGRDHPVVRSMDRWL